MGGVWSRYATWGDANGQSSPSAPRQLSPAEINYKSSLDGSTVLIHAVKNSDPEAVKTFLQNGASISVHDNDGLDALSYALLKGDEKVIIAMLANEHEIQQSRLSRMPTSIDQAAKFYDSRKTGLLETSQSVSWEALSESLPVEQPKKPSPAEQPASKEQGSNQKGLDPASYPSIETPDEDLFYSVTEDPEARKAHLSSLSSSSSEKDSRTESPVMDLPPIDTAPAIALSSPQQWFQSLFSLARRNDSSGDHARSQLFQIGEQVKKLEGEFKKDTQEKNEQREILDVVLGKLEHINRELELFKSAVASPRVEYSYPPSNFPANRPANGILIGNDGGLAADARRFASTPMSPTSSIAPPPPHATSSAPLPPMLGNPPPPPPLPPVGGFPPPPPQPGALRPKASLPRASQPPGQDQSATPSTPKVLGVDDLKRMLLEHFANEIKDVATQKSLAEKWIVFFEKKSSLKFLERIVTDYPFLVGFFRFKPDVVDSRVRYWETHLFEELEEKDRQIWRKKKVIEIQKIDIEKEMDVEIALVKRLLEEQRKKDQEKIEKDASKKVLGDVMSQLKEKIKDRQDTDEAAQDADALKALDDMLNF